MKILNNMKLRNIIKLSFFTLLTIIALLGISATYDVKSISNQIQLLYDRPHTNLTTMIQIKAKIAETGSSLKQGKLTNNPISDTAKSNIEEVPPLLDFLESNKVNAGTPMTDTMKLVIELTNKWKLKSSEFSNLIEQGKAASITLEALEEYNSLEYSLLTEMDGLIKIASENALIFRNRSVNKAQRTITLMIFLFSISVLFSLLILNFVLTNISKPMKAILHAAKEIAKGNLEDPIHYTSNNEFGILANNFRDMQQSLKELISDINKILYEMGQKNFTIQTNATYIGDFHTILSSFYDISNSLSKTLVQINLSAEQVATGSNQLSESAQLLSESATDQSATIEELFASVQDISQQVTTNASHSSQASEQVNTISVKITEGNKKMKQLMDAMKAIIEKSNQISDIIHTIEDISSQTNLLSLNASIEAARAGELGKGFAVVANEVKVLANQSAESAKHTTSLIQDCIKAIAYGTSIAEETANSLNSITTETEKITNVVNDISEASKEQADAIAQVTLGIDQISEVVQSTSATAEETASSSDELSKQSILLKDLVNEFQYNTTL